MRALVQRVREASVTVEGQVRASIGPGLLVLIGATHGDREASADWLARKVAGLRVFGDGEGRMNDDVRAIGGAVLAVPQFTLYGDARRGRRPDFTAAAAPEHAAPLIDRFCATLAGEGVRVERGVFRASMEVRLLNDGPVTLWLESPAGTAAAAAASPAVGETA